MNNLTGKILAIFGVPSVDIAPNPVGIVLQGPNGQPVPAQGDASGNIIVSPSAEPVGTYTEFFAAPTETAIIPVTAKRWGFENSGTGNDSTMNGTAMVGNCARSDDASPAAEITLVAGAANNISGFYSTT